AHRSQSDGSVKCRIFTRLSCDCRTLSLWTQHRHWHCAPDYRSTRCLGVLDLFLPVLQALEYLPGAPDLRRIINRCASGSILFDRRLFGIAVPDGRAWLHLLEHCGRARCESLGGDARDRYVRRANCWHRVRRFPFSVRGFSNWMAWFAQAVEMGSKA